MNIEERIRGIKSDIAIFDRPAASDSIWMLTVIESQQKTIKGMKCCGNCKYVWGDSEGIMLCKNNMSASVHGKCGLWELKE